MKKRIVTILLVFAMVFSMAGVSAFAAEKQTAKSKQLQAAELIVEKCNETIEGLVRAAQRTPYNDVPMLLISVDIVAATASVLVRALGFGVACTYTEYIIDGQSVLIDPLMVINPLDPAE